MDQSTAGPAVSPRPLIDKKARPILSLQRGFTAGDSRIFYVLSGLVDRAVSSFCDL